MLALCGLLMLLSVARSSQPPRIYVNALSETTLKITCEVKDKTQWPQKIYRVHNDNLNLTVSVRLLNSVCDVTPNIPKKYISCECQGTYRVECNISEVHDGDQWKCATNRKGGQIYSNTAYSNMTTYGINTTAVTVEHVTSVSPNLLSNTSKESFTTMESSTGLIGRFLETTSMSVLDQISMTTNVSLQKLDAQFETKMSPSIEQEIFYKKFIIIISVSAVVIVLIAAALLMCVYRNYNHLSDALEAVIAPVDKATSTQSTSAIMPENVTENRQSTVEIYESIPMLVVSPIADSFPLPQGSHILDLAFESESESSIESVHYYETVPDSPSVDGTVISGVIAVSDPHTVSQVYYESLLETRTDGISLYNTL